MSAGFVFWREPLMVAGTRPPRVVLMRLRALIEGRRFAFGQRLAGSIHGLDAAPAIRLCRREPLSAAGDVAEFRKTLRADQIRFIEEHLRSCLEAGA